MSTSYSYSNVPSISEEEFRARAIPTQDLTDPEKYTKSDLEDLAKIERLLDLRSGLLNTDSYYLSKYICECGRKLTIYDFIFTALVDANHEKSLVIQTLIGNKFIINKPRIVRCSNCARQSHIFCSYEMASGYGCSTT